IKMSFNPDIARDVGTDAAIILENIAYWTFFNETREKNFYDGKYWTYNTVEAFSKQFNYLTQRQINYCLQKLKEKGYIETGNYNKTSYDRTLWYTVKGEKYKYHYTKKVNGFDENVKPIPNRKPNKKPNKYNGVKTPLVSSSIKKKNIKLGRDKNYIV